MKRPFLSTLLVATLLPVVPTDAQTTRKRQPLTLGMFLRPYKPQTVTPQIFGLLPDNKYLQEEIKLTAAQKKRMRQIELQLTQVSTVLLEPDVQRELVMSEGQRKKIRKALSDAREKAEKAYLEWKADQAKKRKAGQKKRPATKELAVLRARHREIDAACDKACLNVLTGTQQARFKRLTGKSIDTAKIFDRRTYSAQSLESVFSTYPFEPQTATPKVFGIVRENRYLQQELKLTREQSARMRAIEIRLTLDSWILLDKDIRTELGISTTQYREIDRLRSQYINLIEKELKKSRPRYRAFQKKVRATNDLKSLRQLRDQRRAQRESEQRRRIALKSELESASLRVLTESQRSKFAKMKGKTIDPNKIFHPERPAKSKPLRADI